EQLYIAYSAASGEGLSEGDIAIPPLPPSGEPTIASLLADGIALARDLSGGTWRLSVDEPAAITFDIPEGIQLTLDGRPIRVGETNIDRGLYKIEYAPMLPERLSIIGCVPNPFNARTEIVVALPSAASLKIDIFDISGRSVRSISRKGSAGIVRVVWDGLSDSGAPLSSGLYLVRVRADDEAAFSRAMLIK
ncbi:T9SS type A sorting domain-containing protein, partial [bacterium]|nr:T9SS type A sorting domain-containing protein [bacterium]